MFGGWSFKCDQFSDDLHPNQPFCAAFNPLLPLGHKGEMRKKVKIDHIQLKYHFHLKLSIKSEVNKAKRSKRGSSRFMYPFRV
jgi:hypothetical protein